MQLTACAIATLIGTLPGAALRALGNRFNTHPFTYKSMEGAEIGANTTFTLFSWNVCFPPGGYSITDGGVTPWPDRIDSVVKAICDKDADVVSLYEVMDFHAGVRLFEALKERYAHFYFNIGSQAFGPTSGLFVASKFPVDSPRFTPFPKETLVGRTKHAAKGVFSFGIPQARLFTTHLQHSEIPDHPTLAEVKGRADQMTLIIEEMKNVQGKTAILTGDLNLDSQEYNATKGKNDLAGVVHFKNLPTWGGDQFCAELVGKQASKPQNLDYTTYLKGRNSPKQITTELFTTDFDSSIFKPGALSDHNGLFSEVQI